LHCCHSERRAYYGETDYLIRQKAEKLRQFGIIPIVCVGETLAEREAEQTEHVILTQLAGCFENVRLDHLPEVVIAYEPVWAIGTGRTATPQQAQEVHASIRNWLAKQYNSTIAANTTILYGGSAKPDNFAELLAQPDIDGGLIGGASLDLDAFTKMIQIAIAQQK
jgi:triosephosphate isomerase